MNPKDHLKTTLRKTWRPPHRYSLRFARWLPVDPKANQRTAKRAHLMTIVYHEYPQVRHIEAHQGMSEGDYLEYLEVVILATTPITIYEEN